MADNLSIDSSAALAAGMSYGQYMAAKYDKKPFQPLSPIQIPDGMKQCPICGNIFKRSSCRKYCTPACSEKATKMRERKKDLKRKSRNDYCRKEHDSPCE